MRLERVTPESQGVRSANILSFIEKANDKKRAKSARIGNMKIEQQPKKKAAVFFIVGI